MVTIGVDQSLSHIMLYEHRCLENIKKLYKYSGKYDDKNQYKAIIEAAMVSNPGEFSVKIPLSDDQSEPTKSPSARKSICQFSDVLIFLNFCFQVRC